MINFCISAMGRSGTKFLSTMLNKSSYWTVLHEPFNVETKGLIHEDRLPLVQPRFVDYYGEVNSLLRYVLLDLNVNRKAVIIRDPRDILVSTYNKRSGKLDENLYLELYNSFNILDDILEAGIPVIEFTKMVSDPKYISSIARHFGVGDCIFTKQDCDIKINDGYQLIKSFDRLPRIDKEQGMNSFGKYLEKYFINNPKINYLKEYV